MDREVRDRVTSKRSWRKPELRPVGTLADVVLAGGAKSSLPLDGDGRKPGGLG